MIDEHKNKCTPWVEKYRPTNFETIVLDPVNRTLFENIIKTSYFPNLLLYGPPGTGKTTTIINLVNAYQQAHNQCHKGFMIHLNASDERGIDVIRNQINQYVSSKNLFVDGVKFVVLDEVDYMTKNAQQALRYLLQSYSKNVRFCLICNYISRIDEGLQNEFIKLRFNQLPEVDIITFLHNISKMENLNLTTNTLQLIQKLHKSDIRSMINFMQSNQDNPTEIGLNIIEDTVWLKLYTKIQTNNATEIHEYINEISMMCNVDRKNIIKSFIDYIIHNYQVSTELLSFVECIMHFYDCKETYYINYSLLRLSSLINKL
jgi:DNA polymerase III delta prime subunit